MRADATRVGVTRPGPRQRRPAIDVARRVELAVEQLGRPVDRRGGSSPRARAGASSPAAPARGGCGRGRSGTACTRFAPPRRRASRTASAAIATQVLEVHVVDDVVDRPQDAERARRRPGRAVLDVAVLAAVVPVDRRHAVCDPTPVPVVIEADAAGVTEGKTLTHSAMLVPRRRISPNSGAFPSSTARSSISRLSESTTTRTSFLFISAPASAKNAQSLVLAPGAPALLEQQPERRRRAAT